MPAPHPVRLRPRLYARPWGGDALRALPGAVPPDGPGPVGEAWLADGDAPVLGGPWDGATLGALAADDPAGWLGRAAAPGDARIPVLVKLLDPAAWLSVQVHPDDAYARRRHPDRPDRGKVETWRVLEAPPGAVVAWGFAAPTSADAVRAAIDARTLAGRLRSLPVAPGDVVHNPAGTVHALGPGVRVFELQQASDLTYRLDDHGRVGPDGAPRALHVDDALAVADLSGAPPAPPALEPVEVGWTNRATCPHYALDEADVAGEVEGAATGRRPHVLTVASGALRLTAGERTWAAPEGATFWLPPGTPPVRLAGRGLVLRARPTEVGA